MKIIFVCLGNICRSPMAEYLAKDLAHRRGIDCQISSAGTSGWHDGERMHAKSSAILKELNIAHEDFRSRKLSAKMCDEADIICVMDDANEQDVSQSFNSAKGKIIHLGKFIGQEQIDDPWHTNDFDTTKNDLQKAINKLFDELNSIKAKC